MRQSETDLQIKELSDKYMNIAITDVSDAAGYKIVSTARKAVKKKRVAVENLRKTIIADALGFQKAVNGEANRIKGLLVPIETHLASQEKKYEAENERIRQEERERIEKMINERAQRLVNVGCSPNAQGYSYGDTTITMEQLRNLSDEDFETSFEAIERQFKADQKQKKKEEEAKAKALLAEKKAREKEIAELEKQRREIAAREAAIQQKEDAIEKTPLMQPDKTPEPTSDDVTETEEKPLLAEDADTLIALGEAFNEVQVTDYVMKTKAGQQVKENAMAQVKNALNFLTIEAGKLA